MDGGCRVLSTEAACTRGAELDGGSRASAPPRLFSAWSWTSAEASSKEYRRSTICASMVRVGF